MHTAQGASDIQIFPDAEALSLAAAKLFVEVSQSAQTRAGRFSVALAGGTTPKRVYELLAGDEFRGRVDWPRCHVFFGDERAVPPDHAESNFRMANETLLARVPVPTENIHRMRGESDAVANARLYEDEMREYFGTGEWPALDLVLLGMGDDGHTASLFPRTAALTESSVWVAANWVERLNSFRLTLTPMAINHAKNILFMVAGGAKADRLNEVVNGEYDPERLPAQLIKPLGGKLRWFVDVAAAAKLVRHTSAV